MLTTFPPFYCGSSAILGIAWVGCLGYIPIWRFRPATENDFFWPRGVPIPTFYDEIFGFLWRQLWRHHHRRTAARTRPPNQVIHTDVHTFSLQTARQITPMHAARFTVNVIWMSSLTIPRARSLYSKIVYRVTHWYSRTYTRAITPTRFTWKKFKF
jgi:hypothetical protein